MKVCQRVAHIWADGVHRIEWYRMGVMSCSGLNARFFRWWFWNRRLSQRKASIPSKNNWQFSTTFHGGSWKAGGWGLLPGWLNWEGTAKVVNWPQGVLPPKKNSKTGSAKCAKQYKTTLLCRHERPNSSTSHLEKTKRMDILLQELARSTPPRRGAHKSYAQLVFAGIPLIPKNYDGFLVWKIFGYDVIDLKVHPRPKKITRWLFSGVSPIRWGNWANHKDGPPGWKPKIANSKNYLPRKHVGKVPSIVRFFRVFCFRRNADISGYFYLGYWKVVKGSCLSYLYLTSLRAFGGPKEFFPVSWTWDGPNHA